MCILSILFVQDDLNGMLEYSIVESAARQVFYINPDTGVITARKSLKGISVKDWTVCSTIFLFRYVNVQH